MIKKATKKDISSINELGTIEFSNFAKTYNIEEYIQNDNYVILVNEEKNILNAFIIIYKNIDYFELEMIIVSKEYRQQGIGSLLLNYFFNTICKKGNSILLEVSVENINAINLYRNFDFEIINTRKKYYGTIDAYIMKKVIK